MRIYRQFVSLGSRPVVFAYIRANWFERRAIRRIAARHNLAPAYDWPGPRRYKASFVLAPKGRLCPDRGPCPHPEVNPWYRRIVLDRRFTWLDTGILAASGPGFAHWPLASAMVVMLLVGLSAYLQWKGERT